jgi:hypothetical protein
MRLTPNVITQYVDLNRGVIAAMAIMGGFMIAMYSCLYACGYFCNQAGVEQQLVDDLTIFSIPREETGDKSE